MGCPPPPPPPPKKKKEVREQEKRERPGRREREIEGGRGECIFFGAVWYSTSDPVSLRLASKSLKSTIESNIPL